MANVDLTQGGTYCFSNTGTEIIQAQTVNTPLSLTGVTVTENYSDGGDPISVIFDGNDSNYWLGSSQNSGGGWIRIDLGTPRVFWLIRLVVYFSPTYAINSFKWQGSTTGAFTGEEVTLHTQSTPLVGDNNSGTTDAHLVTISSPGTTPFQYYRMMDIVSNSNSWTLVHELSLYEQILLQQIPTLVCTSGNVPETQIWHGGMTASNASVKMSLDSGMLSNQCKMHPITGQLQIASSTKKLKKDIAPLSDHIPLDSILEIEGVQFKYKLNNNLDAGFIAEDVAEVNPKFAIHGPDWSYNENGEKIPESPGSQIFQKDSDNIVPVDINQLSIITAAVEKIKDLDARIKILVNKDNK